MSQVEPMMMCDGEKKAYAEVTYCFLCKKALGKDRVRHHSHTSGAYLGACLSLCNLYCRRATHIPVFFHNLKGYDSHHIIQALGKYQTEKLKFIATSSEKLMSITLGPLRILDSLQFLNSSSQNLVKNLAVGCSNEGTIFKRMFTAFTDAEKCGLLIRKGVLPV